VNPQTEKKQSRVRWYRRPASVLIIVIVLLLLLAILGTAYLSTSRADRVTSAQNLLAAQGDIQLDGISRMIAGIIVNDLNDAQPFPGSPSTTTFGGFLRGNGVGPAAPSYRLSFRGAWAGGTQYYQGDVVYDSTPHATSFYVCVNAGGALGGTLLAPLGNWHLTSVCNANDATAEQPWMNSNPALSGPISYGMPMGNLVATGFLSQPWIASRIPLLDTTQGWPYWSNISCLLVPPFGTAPIESVIGSLQFEDPTTGTSATTGTIALPTTPGRLYPGFGQYGANGAIYPTLTASGAPGGSVVTWNGKIAASPVPNTMIAADADGDGVADSLLFRIPGAYYDGLTWYAAVRIVDNNSAINVNTAWARDQDYDTNYATLLNWGLFPSNVGLLEMLNAADQTITTPPNFLPDAAKPGFLNYRLNNGNLAAAVPLTPYDESNANFNPVSPPIPATGNYPTSPVRTDFAYFSIGDMFNNQFARRLDNPGLNWNGAAWTHYRAIPAGDGADLAYHFCLVNPNSGATLLESLLPASLTTTNLNVSTAPYSVVYNGASPSWWLNNFFYAPAPGNTQQTNATPVRALLVPRNPVSNYITPLYDVTAPTGPMVTSLVSLATAGGAAVGTLMLPYVSNTFQGTWNAAHPYNFNDIVQFGKYTFISNTVNNMGNTPATFDAGGDGNIATVNEPDWSLQPWTQRPVKANINTATFRELFRAYWSVMAGTPTSGTGVGSNTPFGPTPAEIATIPIPMTEYITAATNMATPGNLDNPYTVPVAAAVNLPWHQFRSVLRDPTAPAPPTTPQNFMDPTNVMLLRAALAAVNAIGQRDETQNIISRTVWLKAYIYNPALTPKPALVQQNVEAQVYSAAPEPVITEVYASNYAGKLDAADPTGLGNPGGYVAVELYNPYSQPMNLTNWQVASINRLNAGGIYPNLTLTNIYTITAADKVTIPAQGYLLLENYPYPGATEVGVGNSANYRPYNSGIYGEGSLTTGGTGQWVGPAASNVLIPKYADFYVQHLENIITPASEMVLLRPRQANGTLTASTDPLNTFNEGNIYDLAPVDSYDFTNFPAVHSNPPDGFAVWSYIRAKDAGELFKANYPGSYDGDSANGSFRQSGTLQTIPLIPEAQLHAGTPIPPAYNTPAFGAPSAGSYPNNFPPIQVYNVGPTAPFEHWPNAIVTGPGNTPTGNPQKFPFGAFPRNGDMLDVPYVGSYRLRVVDNTGAPLNPIVNPAAANPLNVFLELNSLPMDCAFADDGDNTDDTVEEIGRFCPLYARPNAGNPAYPDYYAWARNLFNYLTVQSNTDNYTPNFDPGVYDATTSVPPNTFKYPPTAVAPNTVATPVRNADATATNSTTQDNVGIDGLININTASWKVLSMLPMVTKAEDAGAWQTDNENLAKLIVAWRDGDPNLPAIPAHGPFMSIFDLNEVTNGVQSFQNAYGKLKIPIPNGTGAAGAVTSANGLLSPADASFPGVTGAGGQSSGVTEDYQYDFAVLNRVSNLITTRSDTFTVYIVVEGWQNAVLPGQTAYDPTANPAVPVPTLKVVRRFSFIADRSAINTDPITRYLKTIVVPND
jgi:hypothetical protein